MVDVQGTCDTRFGPDRDALAGQLESGNDTGASITVDAGGRRTRATWSVSWCAA